MKRIKRAFTLLEVMVAFSLIALLLVVGLSAYREMGLLEREADSFRTEAFQRRITQSRLSALFLRIPPPDPFPTDGKWGSKKPSRFFYLSERTEPRLFRAGSLVFTYHNQTDLIPEFCNDVIARLYIREKELGSEEGELWLATWPRPDCSMDPALARHEFLLGGLQKMSWSFYEPPKEEPEKDEPAENPSKEDSAQPAKVAASPTPNSWNQSWSITYGRIPAVVHLQLTFTPKPKQSAEELDLYFPMLQLDRTPALSEVPKLNSSL